MPRTVEPSTIVELPVLADEDIDAFFDVEDLWAVIVWNDDVTTFQTVIQAFVEIFGHTVERADKLAWQIHRSGKAVAAVRPKDEAEAAVHASAPAQDLGHAQPGPDLSGPGPHRSSRGRVRPRRAVSRAFTPGHSAATMEKRADVRTVSSAPGRSARMMPSSWPPIRSMAAYDRSLRTSVCSATRWTFHTSKAWVIMSSFASVLTAVRWAEPASQVKPMSTTSGTPWRWWARPGGHCQKAISQKRVDAHDGDRLPTLRPPCARWRRGSGCPRPPCRAHVAT